MDTVTENVVKGVRRDFCVHATYQAPDSFWPPLIQAGHGGGNRKLCAVDRRTGLLYRSLMARSSHVLCGTWVGNTDFNVWNSALFEICEEKLCKNLDVR